MDRSRSRQNCRPVLHCLMVLVLGLNLPLAQGAGWQKTASTTAVANGEYGRYWTLRNTVSEARANALLEDGTGNLYSTGYIDDGTASVADLLLAKHDSAGNLLWEASFGGAQYDAGVALAMDGASGDVYVAGISYNASDADIVVLKYLADGTQDWVVRYDSGGDDEPVAIVTDGTDVYVTGRSRSATNLDIVTLRYDSAGLNPRVQIYDNGGDDQPVGLALGAGGEVFVGGVSTAVDKDFVLLKYPAGIASSPLWVRRHDSGGGDDDATAMAMAAGRIYLTGWSFSEGIRNYRTVAFNESDGAEAWVAITNYPTGNHTPAAIASNGSSVFVTGRSIHRDAANTDYDLLTMTYDAATGAESASGPSIYDSGADDEALAIVADAAGNSYVLGQSGSPGARNLVTVLYDPAGVQLKAFVYDGGGDETAGILMINGGRHLAAQALALGSDIEGRVTVHAAGGSDRPLPATGTVEGDYTLLKYGVMRAELQVASISGPTLGASGNTIGFATTISNFQDSTTGSLSDSGPFLVGLYLADSPDPLTANLFLLGTRSISDIPSGQNSAATTVVTIPDSVTLPEGTYYLTARADLMNQVVERDESNNLVIGPAINIVNPPDLVPASIAVTNPSSGAAPAATSITLQYAIDNIRAVPTPGPFQVNFVLTANTVVGDADDIFLGSDTVSTIIGGNSSLPPTSVVVTIPNTTPAGDYHVGIIVDANDDILEASDANNTLADSAIFKVQPIPDLTVSSVSAVSPGAVADGGATPLDVDYTVLSSAAPAAGVDLSFYLSTDTTITAADTLLGSTTVSLAADTPFSGTASVSVPIGTAQGVYYVGAIIDPANAVAESDEANNTRAASGTTSVGLPAGTAGALPDLVVSSVTAPATASRGSTITVDNTVANILPEPVNTTFRVGIYLSTDPTISTADILLGSRLISAGAGTPALDGYATNSDATNVLIPFSAPSPVTWTNAVGVTVSGNSLTKTAPSGWGNSGASSVQLVPSNGIVEFTASETTTTREIGLSYSDIDQSFVNTAQALRLKGNGMIDVYANGSLLSVDVVSYAPGDVFRIQRLSRRVSYQKNGTEFFSGSGLGSADMVVDTALNTTGATIQNVNLIVNLTPGTYYIGVVADDQAAVAEVDEGNNAALQSNGSTVLALQQGNGASARNVGGSGGGAWGGLSLLVLLAGAGFRFNRRR